MPCYPAWLWFTRWADGTANPLLAPAKGPPPGNLTLAEPFPWFRIRLSIVAAVPVPLPSASFPEGLLAPLLAISLAGINLLRPLYDPTGALEDFALEYLNPAAQRMTGLPERPGGTMRTRFPETFRNGVFALYQRVYQTGDAGRHDFYYQSDGFDNYFHVAARRSGELLVVSFTDTADQPRTPVEQALRESQAREQAARAEAERERTLLRQILSQAPAYVATFSGPNHVYSFFNEDFARVLTQNRARVGHAFADLFPELVAQGFQAVLDQVYTSGQAFSLSESKVVQRDPATGEERTNYVNISYQPLRDEQGRTYGLLAFATDVTEQVLAAANEELWATNDEFLTSNTALDRTQRQLQQLNQELEARVQARTRERAQAQAETEAQRQRLHQLITEAPALIASLRGPTHIVELANEGFRAIFGGRNLVGKPYREAIPEFESQPFFDRLDRVYHTGETYYGIDEPVILDRTNSGQLEHTYITYTYQATRDAQGQIDGILVFCYEVTQQVLARQEREAQQARLREVFEQAPAAIFVLQGPAYVMEVVNPTMAELLGRPPAELLGRPYFEVVPELAGQGYRDLLDEVWRTGVPHFSQEREGHLPYHDPGEVGYFNFVYQPVRDIQGQVMGIACVTTEVTEQVQARQRVQDLNEELAAINEELQATNEELGDSNQQLIRVNVDLDNFIYTASHDLKAPISNLEGLLYLLREELPADVAQGEVVAPTLTRMRDAVERFKRTIDHLTEVSKLQKEHAPTLAAVDLAAVVEDVRRDLATLLRDTNAELNVAVADFPAILFSEKNLRSVVYNLLSNALKYRHPDRRPHVDVQAHVRGGFTVLEVHDNGLGLDSPHLARLFTMFQRFHDHVEGTGIGLFMVKRMVENAGGRIEVHSQLGAGTTFFVHLPHAPGPSAD